MSNKKNLQKLFGLWVNKHMDIKGKPFTPEIKRKPLTPETIANVSAILEYHFYDIINQNGTGPMYVEVNGQRRELNINGVTFELVNIGRHRQEGSGRYSPKAITVRDSNGNYFVHFNGTGDGNWGYNPAAFGRQPDPSPIQQWSLGYFDDMFQTYIQKTDDFTGKRITPPIFVTGHSQGGNNAKFVTMRSNNSNHITRCVVMDAPGFSDRFYIENRGQTDRRNKIWAFNGAFDYVSALGQRQILLPGRITFLRLTGNGDDLGGFHHIGGKLYRDAEGNLSLFNSDGELSVTDPSSFHLMLRELNRKVIGLPQGEQEQFAYLIMKMIEVLIGCGVAGGVMFINDDFNELMRKLLPFLVEFIEENPALVIAGLTEIANKYPAIIAILLLALPVPNLSLLLPQGDNSNDYICF